MSKILNITDLFLNTRSHIIRNHILLLTYQEPETKKEQNMYGCPFCPEAFLWVGIVFSAHLQKGCGFNLMIVCRLILDFDEMKYFKDFD